MCYVAPERGAGSIASSANWFESGAAAVRGDRANRKARKPSIPGADAKDRAQTQGSVSRCGLEKNFHYKDTKRTKKHKTRHYCTIFTLADHFFLLLCALCVFVVN
jgi:hypothetical protein